jgi:beta propeller repeat protein
MIGPCLVVLLFAGLLLFRSGEVTAVPVEMVDETARYSLLFHTDSNAARNPVTSAHYVVWQDRRTGVWDIYAYDLANGEENRLTKDGCNHTNPAISDHVVVWMTECSGNEANLQGYDFNDRRDLAISGLPGRDERPHVEGDYVVWLSEYGCLDQLCRGAFGYPTAHNLQTGETWRLAEIRTNSPLVTARFAYWAATNGQQYLYDLEGQSLMPSFSMWVEGVSDGHFIVRANGADDDILSLYDPTTGMLSPLGVLPRETADGFVTAQIRYAPELKLLAFVRYRTSSESQIYLYDLVSGEERKLTESNDLIESSLSLSDDVVAWHAQIPSTGFPESDVSVVRLHQRSPRG